MPPPQPIAVAAPTPALKRIVQFDPISGEPVVTTAPMVTKAQVHDVIAAAAADIYIPDPLDPSDKKYEGLPNIEVAVRKQAQKAARDGSPEAVLNRLVGMPKQSSETLHVDVNYADFLKSLGAKLGGEGTAPTPKIIDVTPEDPLSS